MALQKRTLHRRRKVNKIRRKIGRLGSAKEDQMEEEDWKDWIVR